MNGPFTATTSGAASITFYFFNSTGTYSVLSSTASAAFTVQGVTQSPAPPAIQTLSPAAVKAGMPPALVSIEGTGFALGDEVLTWGGPVPTVFVDQATLHFTTPDLGFTGAIPVQVRRTDGTISNTAMLIVEPPAFSISSVTPIVASAAGGNTLTISGTGLAGVSNVNVDDSECTGVVASPTQVTCTIGAHLVLGTYPIRMNHVTTPSSLTYVSAAGLTSVVPAGGTSSGGTALQLSRSNAGAVGSISIGGVPCTGIVANTDGVSCTTAAHQSGIFPILVDGIDSSFTFTYLDGLGDWLLDQQNDGRNGLGASINECCDRIGEVFTAGVTGDLTAISVDVSANTDNSLPLVVSIFSASNQLPTDQLLGQAILSSSSTTLSSLIQLPNAVPVVAGHEYAIVLSYQGALPAGAGQGLGTATGTTGELYAPGAEVAAYPNGSWFSYASQGFDLRFRTYVSPSAAPVAMSPAISYVSPSPLPMNYEGTIDVYGSNFTPTTVLRVNGQPQTTNVPLGDAGHLQATIMPAMVIAPSISIDVYDPVSGLSSGPFTVAVEQPITLMVASPTTSPGGLVTLTATAALPQSESTIRIVLDSAFEAIEAVSSPMVPPPACTIAPPTAPPTVNCTFPMPGEAKIVVTARIKSQPPQPTAAATAWLVVQGSPTFGMTVPITIVPPLTLTAALVPAQPGGTVTVTANVAPQNVAQTVTLTFDSLAIDSVATVQALGAACDTGAFVRTCQVPPSSSATTIAFQAVIKNTALTSTTVTASLSGYSTAFTISILPPPSIELRYVDASGYWQQQQRIENLVVGSRAQACLFSVTSGGLVTPFLEPALSSLTYILSSGSGGSVGGGGGTSFADAYVFPSHSGNSAGATCFSWVSPGAGEQQLFVKIEGMPAITWDTNGDGNNMPAAMLVPNTTSLTIGWNDLEGLTLYSYGASATGTIANPASLTTTFLDPPQSGLPSSTGVTVAFVGSHRRADSTEYRSGQPIQGGPPLPPTWAPPPADGLTGVEWTATPSCGQLPQQPNPSQGVFFLFMSSAGCESQPMVNVTVSGHGPASESGPGPTATGTLQIPGGAPPIYAAESFTLTHDILAACSGIIVTADNVIVDLNGHTITGPHPTSSNSPCVGVDIGTSGATGTPHTGVTIRNGTIQGFSTGVRIWQGANGNTLDSLTLQDNWFNGVSLFGASNNTITRSTMMRNAQGGGAGVVLTGDSHLNTVVNNTITDNFGAGIVAYVQSFQQPPQPLPPSPSNNTITDNQFSGNQGVDINDMTTGGAAPSGVLNTYSGNTCSTSMPAVLCATHQTYVVNSSSSEPDGRCDSSCTLWDAIGAANAHPNAGVPDTITFAPGIGTISLTDNGLPSIMDAVVIDGTIGQTTSCESHNLAVNIRRSGSQYPGPGLVVAANGSNGTNVTTGTVIRGLAIGGFGPAGGNSGNPGIVLNASGVTVECNNLGTDATGTTADGNGAGILVTGANNVIRNNLLSGNVSWAGIALMSPSATGNIVEGNSIGTNASGTGALSNPNGVAIAGGQANTIRNNLIAGNLHAGISLDAAPQGVTPAGVATGNTITDNVIGMYRDALGAQHPLPNEVGIAVNNGTTNQFTGNTIAYNTNNGVVINNGTGNQFTRNTIAYNTNNGAVVNQQLTGNVFSQNSIHHNGGQGLSVNGPQVPNVFYDHPASYSGWNTKLAAAVGGFGAPTIPPDKSVRFEFFHSASCSAGLNTYGLGQGETFFGVQTVQPSASGSAVVHLDISNAAVPAGHFITVTATVEGSSTSGFSRCIAPGLLIDPNEQHSVPVSQSDQEMTISGWGFGQNTVAFMGNPNGLPTPLDVVSQTVPTSMKVRIPASRLGAMGSFNLFLCNTTDVANAPFALGCSPNNHMEVEPVLTGSTPQLYAGSPATQLTITGTGLATTSQGMEVRVSVNGAEGIQALPSDMSATQFTIPIPVDWLTNTGQLQIFARAPGAQPRSNTLTVPIINPVPHLTSLSSSSAVVGSGTVQITLTVSGFRPESTIQGAPGATWSVTDPSHIALSLPTSTVGTLGLKVFTPAPGGGTSETLPFIVSSAPVAAIDVAVGTDSTPVTASAGGGGSQAAVQATTTEGGTGTVAVAVYQAAPETPPAGTFQATNSYVDVYVSPQSTIHALTVTFCDPSGGDVAYFWDGQTWAQASHQSYDPDTHCITITVDDSIPTAPTTSQLQGTAIAAGKNHAPTLGAFTVNAAPVKVGTALPVSVAFADDSDPLDTHQVTFTWGDGTVPSPGTVNESGHAASGSHVYANPGIYTVTATISDGHGGSATASYQFVVVYDPNGGFVTGGGWITSPAGACKLTTACQGSTGKATFGFVAKYLKGANVPTGNTQFQFHDGGLDFKSTSYQWLVIAGTKAQYKGSGTINGTGDYTFMLTAIDGDLQGKGKPDKFRIKIWDTRSGNIVYDNQMDADDAADPTTTLGGGSIIIQKS